MKERKQVNLTNGPIFQSLIQLSLPIMIAYLLNTVYSIVDMAWIGLLGSKAVAGAGVGGMYLWLFQSIAAIARMGGQVNVAQSLGQGKREEAKSYAKAAVQLGMAEAIILSLFCIIFTRQLIALFHLNDAETVSYAIQYTRIVCGLVIFSFMILILTGIYTAQGDSKTALWANLSGLLLNLVLDPMLVLGIGPFPRLEIVGAAIATVCAQFTVMMVLVIGIVRDKSGDNVLKGAKLFQPEEKSIYKKIFQIGTPTAIQSSLFCLINMTLTSIGAGFGSEVVAVMRVGGQIEGISWNMADGFGSAVNSFCAQNYGAGKQERIRKGYNISFLTMGIWGALILFIFLLFPAQISGIFFHDAASIEISVGYLMIVGLCEPFLCIEMMSMGALSGLGRTRLCSAISIIFTSVRIPLAMVLTRTVLGMKGIWFAFTLTSIVKGILLSAAFKIVTKRKGDYEFR